MSTNKNAAIRYQALDKCFSDFHRRYYIETLMERCEEALESFNFEASISRRQIFDDIRFMESPAGWHIPLERIKDGKRTYYRYRDRDFSINRQPLNENEAQQLKTAILTLHRFRGLPSNEWIEEVVSNLEYRFHLNDSSEDVIGFDQNSALRGLHFLSPVIEATVNHQVIKIKYHSYKEERERMFIIHPYYVKQYNNRWFLIGLEDETPYLPNLALDRILSIEPNREIAFIPNRTIDFEHYFDDVVGVTLPDKEVRKETILLRFAPNRFPYVASKPLHLSQQIINAADGTLSIKVRPNLELDQLIFSFLPDVEVLSPASYREQIKRKLEENLKKY